VLLAPLEFISVMLELWMVLQCEIWTSCSFQWYDADAKFMKIKLCTHAHLHKT